MPRGHFQSKTQSGRVHRKQKDNGKFDNVVVIDVDRCKYHNVVTIDAPECSRRGQTGIGSLKDCKERPLEDIISIDDEEDDGNVHHINDNERGDLDSDATSGKIFHPSSLQPNVSHEKSSDVDCEIFEETDLSSKLFKCFQRMHPRRSRISMNHFGLYGDFDSSSSESESDNSDCELVEDSTGKIREQWEKAAYKKSGHPNRIGLDDHFSESGSTSDPRDPCQAASLKNAEKEVTAGCSHYMEQCQNASISSNSDNNVGERESIFTCNTMKPVVKNAAKFSDQMSDQVCNEEAECKEQEDQVLEEHYMCKTLFGDDGTFPKMGLNFCSMKSNDMQYPHYSRSASHNKEPVTTVYNEILSRGRAVSQGKAESDSSEHACHNSHSMHDGRVCHDGARFQDLYLHVDQASVDSVHPADERTGMTKTGFKDEEAVSDMLSLSKFCGKFPVKIDCNNRKTVWEKVPQVSAHACDMSQHIDDTGCLQSGEKGIREPFLFKAQKEEDREKPEVNGVVTSNEDGDDHQRSIHGDPKILNGLIGEREKLKETDEYKRALEEELASRQLQLRIQAEEAQRLRKRKKAENMRLLDMDRRLKQRIEEVRQIQKKDQETIDLKEKLRAEIREELDKLETRYVDMPSLLRGLGICVGGGLYPSSREINAAYKQALLKFHPDRASKLDIRQQVEAEEIFKLISRLKEKLLPFM